MLLSNVFIFNVQNMNMNYVELAMTLASGNEMFYVVTMIKLLLGILAVAYIINFYISWKTKRKTLSIISFYALRKIATKAKGLTIGLIFLVVSFVLEFLILTGMLSINLFIWVSIMQVIGVAIMGYTLYEMMRNDLPTAKTAEQVSDLPISSMPMPIIREMNRDQHLYDEKYIKEKLSNVPVPKNILKKTKHTTKVKHTTKIKHKKKRNVRKTTRKKSRKNVKKQR